MLVQQLHQAGRNGRLGQDAPPNGKAPIEDKLPEVTERDILKLQAQAAREQITTHKYARIWDAIGAIVGVGTLIVAVRAMRSR